MNLRNVEKYNIGLDLGTGSVGWSVTDENGELCYFKGKPTWGSRIFPSAQPAAETRSARGLRRRYNRRRWRLNLLQDIFKPEMDKVDPDFFIRLNQSSLFPEDRSGINKDYLYTLFNDSDFTEKDFFKKFPTIYHLRKWLMETNEKADIRLIYLAMHNIVKHRGNFLWQDKTDLTSENANVDVAVQEFCLVLQEYCDETGITCGASDNEAEIINALSNMKLTRTDIQKHVQELLRIEAHEDGIYDKASLKKFAKAVSSALVGLSSEMADIFFLIEEKPEDKNTKIHLSKDDDVEAFQEICPDLGLPLFEAIKKVYSSYVLQEILSSCPGESLAINKVKDYEKYGEDLRLLKLLVKKYVPTKYDIFFRGDFYPATGLHPQKNVYDKSKAQGYTKYNVDHKWPYHEFKKSVVKLFSGTPAIDDPRYQQMMENFENTKFLRRLKTSDNGAIPFQLNLEEVDKIIDNQKRFYAFLESEKEKLDSLIKFRIPYYVGPLTTKNARVDSKGNFRFAWSKKKEEKRDEPIRPWNWEDVIDKNKSAENFIYRMTGTCSYILDEPVLPKCSLLYEEYCVLNELNGAKFSQDGDKWYRFDYEDRMNMLKDLFKKGRVSYKKAQDWMNSHNHSNVHVKGSQGESGFESKLSSYIFFAKDVFHVDEIPESDIPMIEEIILWSTLFEDRSIFREKLIQQYGSRLSQEQVNKIVKKRFMGWGRLSKKLLTGVYAETDNGRKSIMDVLREGNPNNNHLSKPMVLMEIIHDDNFKFDELIDSLNKEKITDGQGLALEQLPGSPALRRSVKQALDIVEEIIHIAGHEPENIFIEVAREDDFAKKGRRTKKRYDKLTEALSELKSQAPEYWDSVVSDQLKQYEKAGSALDERLTLYFMQGGKSLYSGKQLDVGRLMEYEVDHILPQSYIKDDSFENKALVLKSENQNKSDQMLLPTDMHRKMKPYWNALLKAGLIGEKKHRNLLRETVTEKQMNGFIARQLVETRQIMKVIQSFLQERYSETNILPVKAGLSHELREKIGLVKCREINDYHHAHDALLASEIGRFIQKRHPGMYDKSNPYTKIMKEFIKRESHNSRKGKAPGSVSFVIASFLRSGFDEETGELFQDDWSAEIERMKLKKYFNYRQCYISRMPEETSGAFWDPTIYSPRGGKKTGHIPLKKNLSPEKYGGYSELKRAYFILIEAHDTKGNPKRLFEGVSIPEAVLIKAGELNIEDLAKNITESKGLLFNRIIRGRLLRYTRIDHGGNEFYIPALDCVYSSRELVLDDRLSMVAAMVCNKNIYDNELILKDLIDLYDMLAKKSLILCSRFKSVYNRMIDGKSEFMKLDIANQRKLLINLFNFFNGVTSRVDLTLIGGSPHAGGITNSFLFNPKESICIIDQSVTGMFERRMHIGL